MLEMPCNFLDEEIRKKNLEIFKIIFCLCYYRCPTIFPFDSLYQAPPPTPSGNPTPLSMCMGHAYIFFSYSIPCTVLYIPVTTL